jgi:hypothetical protein
MTRTDESGWLSDAAGAAVEANFCSLNSSSLVVHIGHLTTMGPHRGGFAICRQRCMSDDGAMQADSEAIDRRGGAKEGPGDKGGAGACMKKPSSLSRPFQFVFSADGLPHQT